MAGESRLPLTEGGDGPAPIGRRASSVPKQEEAASDLPSSSSSSQAELKAPEGPGSAVSTVLSQTHSPRCPEWPSVPGPATGLLALPQPRGELPRPTMAFPSQTTLCTH